MKKVVALLGDYYHKEEWACEALEEALKPEIQSNAIDLSFISYDQLVDVLSNQPEAVILFKEDRINPTDENINLWMTPEIALKITEYVNNGGSWLAWHSGLASYSVEGDYTKMLKGHFLHHPNQHQQVFYSAVESNVGVNSPSGYEILDEHYFVQCDEAATEVFLRSESVDGKSIAGWAHGYGNGRVCCFTPAHNKEGMLHPGTLELLNRSIHWCLG